MEVVILDCHKRHRIEIRKVLQLCSYDNTGHNIKYLIKPEVEIMQKPHLQQLFILFGSVCKISKLFIYLRISTSRNEAN